MNHTDPIQIRGFFVHAPKPNNRTAVNPCGLCSSDSRVKEETWAPVSNDHSYINTLTQEMVVCESKILWGCLWLGERTGSCLIFNTSDEWPEGGGRGVCDREAGEKYGEREKSKRNGVRKTKRVKEKQRGEIGYKIERKRLRKGWRRGLRGCGRKSRWLIYEHCVNQRNLILFPPPPTPTPTPHTLHRDYSVSVCERVCTCVCVCVYVCVWELKMSLLYVFENWRCL